MFDFNLAHAPMVDDQCTHMYKYRVALYVHNAVTEYPQVLSDHVANTVL